MPKNIKAWLWFLVFSLAWVSPSIAHQMPPGHKRFSDPSPSDQTGSLIAQKCSSGFYRKWSGPLRGQCVPCSCNGLSDQCDELTGKCVNCQFHSAGDHCERCQEGYYGDAAQKSCRVCPCPFTWNNRALACMNVGAGVVECLCKRGYAGSRCERCAFGYYGNPETHGGSCKPCKCDTDGDGNICHSLTGEYISPGNNSCEDQFHALKCCTEALLPHLRANEGDLRGLARISAPVLTLIHPQAIVSDVESVVKSYRGARRYLEIEQLEEDVNVIRKDLNHLRNKVLQLSSRVNEGLHSRKGSKRRAKILLGHAESIMASFPDLIKRPSRAADAIRLGGSDKATVMEETRRLVEEMSRMVCGEATTEGSTRGQREMAKKLLDGITKMAAMRPNQQTLNQTANSLLASHALLGHMTGLVSGAKFAVRSARRVNLKSAFTLRHVLTRRHGQGPTTTQTRSIRALNERTRRNQLQNISDILKLLDVKHTFEENAARLDGAERLLRNRMNNIYRVVRTEIIGKAEEHAGELGRLATDMQKMLPTADGTKRSSEPNRLKSITTHTEEAAMAAVQADKAADKALKDMAQDGLLLTSESMREYFTSVWTTANHTQNDFITLSESLNACKDGMKRQQDKRKSLQFDISRVSHEIKSLKRDDMNVMIQSAKRETSVTNDTATHVTNRLMNMGEEMARLTLNNSALAFNNILNHVQHSVRRLKWVLPVMTDKLVQMEALANTSPARGNMTENISMIKDLVQETRSYLDRISLATAFRGKGHIELRPPSNTEDLKAFTALSLLLSVEKKPAESSRDQQRDDDMFVLYLGHEDSSGDFIGMAIRHGVLICIYKLGGHVHEVEAGPITTFTGVNPSALDHVVFHRIYHDAEVNITANFTSEWPLPFTPKRHLPNTASGILDLDPQRTVFYVGGYPQHFSPPKELRYPNYRGYVKLLHINDKPLCLYNFKRAVNMEPGVHALMLPGSEVSHYYQGSGYREVLVKEPYKMRKRIFKLRVKSWESDALLFYIGTEESFWCVLVEQGNLMIQGQQEEIKWQPWRLDSVSLFNKHFTITIDDMFTVSYEDQFFSVKHVHIPIQSFYIGGVPQHIRTRHDIVAPPLKGCVDLVSADGQIVEYNTTIGVSDACPFGLPGVRTATLRSPLSGDRLLAPDQLRLALGFRSMHKNGGILRSSTQSTFLSHISLADGFLQFRLGHHCLTSSQRYNDGRWHYLCTAHTPRLEVQVDNVDINLNVSVEEAEVKQEEEFRVCIADLYSRSAAQSFTPVDLNSPPPTAGVTPGQCRLGSLTPTPQLPTDVNRQLEKLRKTGDQTDGECGRQRPPRRGYQLSQGDSWLAYKLSQQDLNYRPHFSLDVKTKSSKGLILYVEGTGPVPLLALYVTNGKIKMSLGPSRVIHHKLKTNDGHWHRVDCSVEKNTFHLLVDGIRVIDGNLPNEEGSFLNFHSFVYLGGHPGVTKGRQILLKSISGCVRDFRMNDYPVGKPEAARGVSPCLDGLTESGAYFGGGHVILDDPFAVGAHFALTFELRPHRVTGLLFHAQAHGSSFDVFLINNTVGVTVNDGGGSVSAALTPQNLCDGEFHVIKVSTGPKRLTLTVDVISEKKAGSFAAFLSSMKRALLHIGGVTDSSVAPVTSPYMGCLRNVIINGRRIAFETQAVTVLGPVDVKACPAL
ncbi:laminin subunit alpha-3 isoform X1 [Syngnathus scovelli]|uniref:laminin subunit alpha-3 isoform X1 n=1 Tax=Syngnathus scovelli TaxID=161590 RepID=UPI0021108ED1|nr:laminin subunit alpha-3 isoform X1 [Syngnathus scovelli]